MNSPVARLELAHLQRRLIKRGKWLRILDILMLLGCIWVATIPLRVYVVHETRNWLFLMMFVITGLHFAVGLRTLILASNSIAREQAPGKWDVFVLTGLDASQIIIGKWWAVIRYTALSHIFVAFLRLGLALAYTQYLHGEFSPLNCPFGGQVFCHISWHGGSLSYFPELYPTQSKVILAIIMLVIFAVLEVALLSAFGLLATLLHKSRYLRFFFAVCLRGFLFIVAVLGIFAGEFNIQIANSFVYLNCSRDYYSRCGDDWILVLETIEIGISTFGDNGNFIAAMVMRPVGNELFVFRNIMGSGLIGVILYLFFIWLALRLSQILIIRQRALRTELFKR